MHIPDGYLSPIISVGLGAATVPGWAVATNRVQKVLSDRTIPLLAIFSAMSFTVMMFNVPVPGGTTAHGVGGTLIAIVLGPWAAAIAISVALIIQALFFGDGGILAIFANCLNMAFILPFVGYATYRVVAGGSPMLSTRRVWAAGIGAYMGITASALAVGIELGIQPILFSENGHALYSPYGLAAAIPAMLIAHAFGASIVEALITAFGVAWIQQRHPEYLGSLGRGLEDDRDVADGMTAGPDQGASDDAEPDAAPRPLWQTGAVLVAVSLAIIGAAALATGGGDPAHAFGTDWAAVDWPSVATMLLVVALIAAMLVPLAWVLLPRRYRGVGTAFVAAAVLAPLGLIAPGFAYGEGSAEDVGAAFGYVPAGLQHLSSVFTAPLAGYNLPLPFFSHARSALWQQAVGYEITGILGILLMGGVMLALGRLLLHRQHAAAEHQDGAGWLEHTVSGITASVERSIFTEEHARSAGWLQGVDPRAKLGMFLAAVLAASLSSSVVVLVRALRRRAGGGTGEPDPVRLLRPPRLARHPVLRGPDRHPGHLPRPRPAAVRARGWPDHHRAVDPRAGGRRAVRDPGRRQRLAGGPAGHDHALGRPAQEPRGGTRPQAVHPRARDGLPVHLPVPAHHQRHVRGPQEPDRRAHQRR